MGDPVDTAVEKMLTKAPADPNAEKPSAAKAPAADAPVKNAPESSAHEDGPSASSDEKGELTAFEQELIQEFQEEYALVPEVAKPAYLAALKRSYRKNSKQLSELGTLRKAVGALQEAGITNEDLVDLIQRKRGKGSAPSSSTGETKRGFSRYEEKVTDPDQRKELLEARQVMREELEDFLTEFRDKEVKPLQEKLDAEERRRATERTRTLESEIDALEEKQGFKGSLVETYRQDIRRMGLQHPTLSAKRLLYMIADPEEIEAGRDLRRSVSQKAHQETVVNGAVVKKAEASDLPRNKRGVVSVLSGIDHILNRKH